MGVMCLLSDLSLHAAFNHLDVQVFKHVYMLRLELINLLQKSLIIDVVYPLVSVANALATVSDTSLEVWLKPNWRSGSSLTGGLAQA